MITRISRPVALRTVFTFAAAVGAVLALGSIA